MKRSDFARRLMAAPVVPVDRSVIPGMTAFEYLAQQMRAGNV